MSSFKNIVLMNMRNFTLIRKERVVVQKNQHFLFQRAIGTSSNSDLSSITSEGLTKPEFKRTKKHNWKSYGFDFIDQRKDIFYMHASSFFLITVFMWGCTFIFAYYPDIDDRNWVQREAHIELRRREVLGLPLIDPNYVDPATIILPPDETLGDDEIII